MYELFRSALVGVPSTRRSTPSDSGRQSLKFELSSVSSVESRPPTVEVNAKRDNVPMDTTPAAAIQDKDEMMDVNTKIGEESEEDKSEEVAKVSWI